METYGDFYIDDGISIRFIKNGEILFSNFPEGLFAPEVQKTSTQRVNGNRYFAVTHEINNGEYIFTYAKDVSFLDDDFLQISITFIITSLGASAVLAICLFLVLRKLSKPLEKLSSAAREIADGNFETRADEKGNDDISLIAADFNRMAEHVSQQMKQLESESETKQRMLDNLAHEMINSTASIFSSSSMFASLKYSA